MTTKGRDNTTEFSPLMFMAHFLEIIAVFLFLVMLTDFSPKSSEDQLALFNIIGFFVLFAWLFRKIDKMIQIPADVLDTLSYRLSHFLTNVAPAGSSIYKPIELKKLCGWHRYSFWLAFGFIMLVSMAALVVLSMFILAEGSPVTSTAWDWTYRITMPILGICLVWMLATLFHSRRRCASKVRDGLDKSAI